MYLCTFKQQFMETVLRVYSRLLDATDLKFTRYLYTDIDWSNRLIAISGSRGTGKTTLLLQYIKKDIADKSKALYVSLDNIWFTTHTLSELVEQFYVMGGEHIFLDEVHRYPNWAIELKNIYDSYPDLKIVFTGSSMLEIYQSQADLSRRAIHYSLYGMSFREFLLLKYNMNYPVRTLNDILTNHFIHSSEITNGIKILPYFVEYLKYGYYPIFKENIASYPERIQGIVNAVIDADLPACSTIEYSSGLKIKKLLAIISSIVPYTPNVTKLSAEIGISRNSLLSYIHLLHQARLIFTLSSDAKGMSILAKPDKIYLDNPNLLFTLSTANTNDGNVRETFFANQLKVKHAVNSSKQTDFLIDSKYLFEIGGKNKSYEQIKNLNDSFVAVDGVESGFGNKIPLWLFGFLY